MEQVKKALLSKDLELFENAFQQLVLESISFYNTTLNGKRKNSNQNEVQDSNNNFRLCLSNHSCSGELLDYWKIPYQIFMLGFLTSMQDKFFVTPEQESGLGRADILKIGIAFRGKEVEFSY